MLNNVDIHQIKEVCEGLMLDAIWWNIPSFFGECDFESRKILLFLIMQKFMEKGWLKIANHGIFLEGTIKEQIQRFKDAFPKTEEELYHGLWFTFEECPGGTVWVLDDGTLDWT